MSTVLTALPVTAKVLARQEVSLLDVVRAIQADALAEMPQQPKVTLPKKVQPTELQRERVERLLDTLDELKLPHTRRKLSTAEKRNILRWTLEIKDIAKLLDTTIDQLKAAFFGHADVLAEEDGRAVSGQTLRDKAGWYLLEDKEKAGVVTGEPFKLVREYRSGSVSMEVSAIDQLVAEGVLTAEERAASVETVERVNEAGLMKILAEKPHLIKTVVAKAKQTSSPSVAFHVRQNK